MTRRLIGLCLIACGLVACDASSGVSDAGVDAATDADTFDGGEDAGEDAGVDAGPRDAGDVDPALVDPCIACHLAEGDAWRRHLTSHRLVLFCTTCHVVTDGDAGVGHADSRACATCHSTASHPAPDARCTSCHDPHGTANLYLIREALELADAGIRELRFTSLEGASADGLVRAGVADAAVGTGLCEACHTTTAHYTQTGSAASHFRTLCSDCHLHELGFSAPPP